MNLAIVFFVLCFSAAFALNPSGPIGNYTEQHNKPCLDEYGISTVKLLLIKLNQDSRDAFCLEACKFRGLGMMHSNGTINLAGVKKFYDEFPQAENKELFYQSYEACKDGKIGCELVECLSHKAKGLRGYK